MELTAKQIRAIRAAAPGDVVFVSLEAGTHPSAYAASIKALENLKAASDAKGDHFPRVVVMPPGVKVDISRADAAPQRGPKRVSIDDHQHSTNQPA